MKLALIRKAVSEKMFGNNGHIHVYSNGEGAHNPLGSNSFSLHVTHSSIQSI